MKSCFSGCVVSGLVLTLLLTLPLVGQEPRLTSIAEGYASRDGSIEIGYRAFTAPELQELISSGLRVESIEASPTVFRLQAGERRSFGELRVIARDRRGGLLSRIPFSVGLEDVSPPIVSIEALRVNGDEIEGIRAGETRLKIMAAVPGESGTSAASMIRIVVTDE